MNDERNKQTYSCVRRAEMYWQMVGKMLGKNEVADDVTGRTDSRRWTYKSNDYGYEYIIPKWRTLAAC